MGRSSVSQMTLPGPPECILVCQITGGASIGVHFGPPSDTSGSDRSFWSSGSCGQASTRLRFPPVSTPTPEELIAGAKTAAFESDDPAKAFEHFRALAEAVSTDELPVFTGQPLVMLANIKRALEAIEHHLPAAVARLRDARLQGIFELPALTLGLSLAANRVPGSKLSSGEIESLFGEVSNTRLLTLDYLEVVSNPQLGLVPAERVRTIREGTGKIDKAEDFVAIASLFREFAGPLTGKHPFSPEMLTRMGEVGAALLGQLKPGAAAVAAPKRTPESLLRDQFAQLVADRYDDLEVLTAVAVGRRKANDLLPNLRSFVAPAKAEPKPA